MIPENARERVEAFHKVVLREGQFILDNEMRTVGLNIRIRVIVHEQKAYLSVMTNGELTGFQRLNIKEEDTDEPAGSSETV